MCTGWGPSPQVPKEAADSEVGARGPSRGRNHVVPLSEVTRPVGGAAGGGGGPSPFQHLGGSVAAQGVSFPGSRGSRKSRKRRRAEEGGVGAGGERGVSLRPAPDALQWLGGGWSDGRGLEEVAARLPPTSRPRPSEPWAHGPPSFPLLRWELRRGFHSRRAQG